MKVTVARKDLAEAVAAARRATKKETSLPILKRLLIQATEDGRFSVLGYNLQQSAQVFRTAKVAEPGSAVPDADLFSELVSSLPECEVKLALDLDNDGIYLYAAGSEYFFAGMPAAEFVLPNPEMSELWKSQPVAGGVLKSALERVVFAASKPGTTENVRHTGISLRVENNLLEFCATDTHRLAISKVPCGTSGHEIRIILPADCAATLLPALSDEYPVNLFLSGKEAVFVTKDLIVGTLLIDGAYTKYEKAVEKSTSNYLWSVEFDRAMFAAALARVRIMAKYQLMPHRILMEVLDGKVRLKASAGEGKGGEVMDGVTDLTAPASVGLHGQHVADWIGAVKTERVRLSLSERSAVLTPIEDASGVESLCLLVPIEDIHYAASPVEEPEPAAAL